MKITDVTVTLFAWDTMPAIGYHGVHGFSSAARRLQGELFTSRKRASLKLQFHAIETDR